jgi:hypothetical protein
MSHANVEEKLFFANNIWIINDIVIPLTNNGPIVGFYGKKSLYSQPESFYYGNFQSNKKILAQFEKELLESKNYRTHNNFSLSINKNNHLKISNYNSENVITYFACNKQGKYSLPTVIMPLNKDIEQNLKTHVLHNHLNFENIANEGELNELNSFKNWLQRYYLLFIQNLKNI